MIQTAAQPMLYNESMQPKVYRNRIYARTNPMERFWAKVDKSGDCWLWTGNRDRKGYGGFNENGSNVRAHRYSYKLANGTPAPGLLILHHCDNPPCVRPSHLYAGTARQNSHDMMTRGRNAGQFKDAGAKTKTCSQCGASGGYLTRGMCKLDYLRWRRKNLNGGTCKTCKKEAHLITGLCNACYLKRKKL